MQLGSGRPMVSVNGEEKAHQSLVSETNPVGTSYSLFSFIIWHRCFHVLNDMSVIARLYTTKAATVT